MTASFRVNWIFNTLLQNERTIKIRECNSDPNRSYQKILPVSVKSHHWLLLSTSGLRMKPWTHRRNEPTHHDHCERWQARSLIVLLCLRANSRLCSGFPLFTAFILQSLQKNRNCFWIVSMLSVTTWLATEIVERILFTTVSPLSQNVHSNCKSPANLRQ